MATLKSPHNLIAPTKPRRQIREWLGPIIVLLLSAGIYFITSASGLTWKNGGEDGGDLAMAAKLLGIAHPTGYPLYLLLAQPLIWFGIEPIRALNLLSGWYGAIACALLTLSVTDLIKLNYPINHSSSLATKTNPGVKFATTRNLNQLTCWAGGVAAGLSLAFAPLFWSQAVVAEVYSLEAALTTFTLWALIRWYAFQQKSTANPEHGLGLVLLASGLALAHHRTAVLTLLAIIVTLGFSLGWQNLLTFARRLKIRTLLAGLGLLVVGFSSYLYVLVRGGQVPAANWLNPGWNNLGGFWDEFNASFYHNLLFAAPATQSFGRISAIAQYLVANFGIWGIILGLAGWWAVANSPRLKPFFWFAIVAFVAHTAFAAIYAADNSQVYLIPAFIIWATLIGLGLAYVLGQLSQIALGYQFEIIIAVTVVGILAGLQLILNYNNLDASQDQTAQTWVSQTLNTAPANAILLSQEDKYTFGLWYAQNVQGRRKDLKLVETRLLPFEWYRENLKRLYPSLQLSANLEARTASQLTQLNPGVPIFEVGANGLQANQ